MAQLVETLSYKPKVVVSIPDGVNSACIDLILPAALGASTSRNPQGLSRLVQGLLCLLLFFDFTSRYIAERHRCRRYLRISRFFIILGGFAKLRKGTISFVMSVRPYVRLSVPPSDRPHGTTRLPLNWFSRNLIFEYLSKVCREISSFIKMRLEKSYFIWIPIQIFQLISLIYSYNEKCFR